LENIDEDPNQPRRVFNEASLNELAESIKSRGLKSPISVRPGADGHYIINHGARRLRAHKILGKLTIPAFLDTDFQELDQLIENLQRDDLQPKEIADYIGRLSSKGMRGEQIATAIGKSSAYVTQHLNLLRLPKPVEEAFAAGKVTDVTVAYELSKEHKKDPQAVEQFLADTSDKDVTRSSVKSLKDYIKSEEENKEILPLGGKPSANTLKVPGGGASGKPAKGGKGSGASGKKGASGGEKWRSVVQVTINDKMAEILQNRRPSDSKHTWCRWSDGKSDDFEAENVSIKYFGLFELFGDDK
jgi:ParB family chromosome partitioning protein